MSTMKVVRIHTYGSSDVLTYESAPCPLPGEGEMLIRVHATSVNPFDIAVRAGYMASYFDYTLPLILGTDVSGVVEELGPGTNSFSPGDAVYTRAGVYRDGSYAEYAVATSAEVTAKPNSLDHTHAAAIPHVALTAWQALFELADLSEGQTVLIHGAAGGVGHIAVQLAKWRGAKVIGTASINYDLLENLGVDQAINYSKTAFEDVVQDVDVVLDTMGGDTQQRSWSTLKRGGVLVSTVEAPSAEVAEAQGVRQAMVMSAPPVAETLTTIAEMVEAGQIKPVVSTVLPLEDAQKAHQIVETKHARGKIILQVTP
jgi:NADPH:quinone reductase-like Zn-dependent oxidoreductase